MDKLWDIVAHQYASHLNDFMVLYAMDAVHLVHPIGNVLDVACGSGSVVESILKLKKTRGLECTLLATDYSSEMTSIVKNRFNVDVMVQDGMQLPDLQNDFYNVVYSMFGLFMFPDNKQGCKAVYRVLKSEGILVTSMWDDYLNCPLQFTFNGLINKILTFHRQNSVDTSLTIGGFVNNLSVVGFKDIKQHKVVHNFIFESMDALMDMLRQSSVLSLVLFKNITKEREMRLIQLISDYIGDVVPIVLPYYATILSALK